MPRYRQRLAKNGNLRPYKKTPKLRAAGLSTGGALGAGINTGGSVNVKKLARKAANSAKAYATDPEKYHEIAETAIRKAKNTGNTVVRKAKRTGKKARRVAAEMQGVAQMGVDYGKKVVSDVKEHGFSSLHDHAMHAYSSYPHAISHIRKASPHTMSLIRHSAALLSGHPSQEVLHHHLGKEDMHRGGIFKPRYERVPVAAYRDIMRSSAHSLGGALSSELMDRANGYQGNGLAAAT